MKTWYALYTKPHCERQVERALEAKGIESFFPAMPVASPRRGRPLFRPFFPCYLFAYTDLEVVGVSCLNWIPGMRHLVTFGNVPATLDERVIARIRAHLAQPHAMDAQGEFLQSGDRVLITAGPLRDIEAVFDKRLSASGRVRVLVDLLRRWTPVEMQADDLRRVAPVPKTGRHASERERVRRALAGKDRNGGI